MNVELLSPSVITWKLPGHDYTMTIYRINSLKKWIKSNRSRIMDYQILDLAPHHSKIPSIVAHVLEGKTKRRKVPFISQQDAHQENSSWTVVVKADDYENLIYLNKLHLFLSVKGRGGDVSLCGRVDVDNMAFVDAYTEDPTDKNTCKFCTWAFIRKHRE